MSCDGTETICLSLTDEAETRASGATNQGGTFSSRGYQPANRGGLDWAFGPGADLSAARVEVDVTGLVPVDADEGSGGKVSIFDVCATTSGWADYVGLQKMTWDYHDGHNFRYGLDDDELADGWDAAVITSADMGCYYDIDTWTADQTHHIVATWDHDGVQVWIDDFECHGWGNGDRFDPPDKLFVLANRCQHYDNQQAVAWFSDFRFWMLGEGGTPPEDTGTTDDPGEDSGTPPDPTDTAVPDDCTPAMRAVSVDPADGAGTHVQLTTRFDHCGGAAQFTLTQLSVSDDPGLDGLLAAWHDGRFSVEGHTCAAGDPMVLTGARGALDCAASSARTDGDTLYVTWAVTFDPTAFAGDHGVWAAASDASGATGWQRLGRYTVPGSDADGADGGALGAGCACGTAAGTGGWLGAAWAVLGAALFGGRRGGQRRKRTTQS